MKAKDENPFVCKVCDNCTFATEQTLKTHLDSKKHKVNAGDMAPKTTYCELCKKQLLNRRQYLKHCRNIHGIKQRIKVV